MLYALLCSDQNNKHTNIKCRTLCFASTFVDGGCLHCHEVLLLNLLLYKVCGACQFRQRYNFVAPSSTHRFDEGLTLGVFTF
jgi:hypothetical protein